MTDEETDNPGDPGDPTEPPDPEGTPEEQIAALLAQAQQALEDAQTALENGDLAEYQDKNEEAAGYIAEALEIADREGLAPSEAPSDSESASESASPVEPRIAASAVTSPDLNAEPPVT